MVQYSITPWRQPSDLLALRRAFYPFGDPTSPHAIHQTTLLLQSPTRLAQLNLAKSRAISLVSLYVSRGNCPHLLASTSLLLSALLLDTPGNPQKDAIKCAYAAAFGRFVTGLLDGYQSKRYKQSMYAIAKQIGLPSSFVELRHQCTHEELPSVHRLRRAVEGSLAWLWRGYWADLGVWEEGGEGGMSAGVGLLVSGELAERMNVVDEIEREDEEARYASLERELGEEESLREVMRRYLVWRAEEDGDQHVRMVYSRRLIGESMEDKLEALESLRDSGDSTLMLASMKLFREVMNGEGDSEIFAESAEEEEEVDITRDLTGKIDSDEVEPAEEEERHRKRVKLMEEEVDEEEGWKMWEGPWVPKPIGIV